MKKVVAMIAAVMMFSGVASAYEFSLSDLVDPSISLDRDDGLTFGLKVLKQDVAGFNINGTENFGLAVSAEALTFGGSVNADILDVEVGAKGPWHSGSIGVDPDGPKGEFNHDH